LGIYICKSKNKDGTKLQDLKFSKIYILKIFTGKNKTYLNVIFFFHHLYIFRSFFSSSSQKEQNLLISLNLNVTKIKYISNIYTLNSSNKETEGDCK